MRPAPLRLLRRHRPPQPPLCRLGVELDLDAVRDAELAGHRLPLDSLAPDLRRRSAEWQGQQCCTHARPAWRTWLRLQRRASLATRRLCAAAALKGAGPGATAAEPSPPPERESWAPAADDACPLRLLLKEAEEGASASESSSEPILGSRELRSTPSAATAGVSRLLTPPSSPATSGPNRSPPSSKILRRGAAAAGAGANGGRMGGGAAAAGAGAISGACCGDGVPFGPSGDPAPTDCEAADPPCVVSASSAPSSLSAPPSPSSPSLPSLSSLEKALSPRPASSSSSASPSESRSRPQASSAPPPAVDAKLDAGARCAAAAAGSADPDPPVEGAAASPPSACWFMRATATLSRDESDVASVLLPECLRTPPAATPPGWPDGYASRPSAAAAMALPAALSPERFDVPNMPPNLAAGRAAGRGRGGASWSQYRLSRRTENRDHTSVDAGSPKPP